MHTMGRCASDASLACTKRPPHQPHFVHRSFSRDRSCHLRPADIAAKPLDSSMYRECGRSIRNVYARFYVWHGSLSAMWSAVLPALLTAASPQRILSLLLSGRRIDYLSLDQPVSLTITEKEFSADAKGGAHDAGNQDTHHEIYCKHCSEPPLFVHEHSIFRENKLNLKPAGLFYKKMTAKEIRTCRRSLKRSRSRYSSRQIPSCCCGCSGCRGRSG